MASSPDPRQARRAGGKKELANNDEKIDEPSQIYATRVR